MNPIKVLEFVETIEGGQTLNVFVPDVNTDQLVGTYATLWLGNTSAQGQPLNPVVPLNYLMDWDGINIAAPHVVGATYVNWSAAGEPVPDDIDLRITLLYLEG